MRFYVTDAVPVKRRVRFTRDGRAYTDKRTAGELRMVAEAYGGPFYKGPVALLIRVYKPKKSLAKGKSEPYTQKPDLDNVVKAVMDGLTGKAYADDRQVVAVYARKLERERIGHPFCAFAVIEADMLAASVDAEIVG